MSKNVTIRPEQLEKAVIKALAEYGDEVEERVNTTTKAVVREAVSELKRSAPSGGQYGRGWSHKADKGRVGKIATETIYNRIYQLTHLLEKPHSTGHGGHYPKNVDYTGTLARVEEKYTEKYYQEVLSKL